MSPLSFVFAVLNIFFLSVLGAPLPSGQPLEKRIYYGDGTWFYDGLGACGYWNSNSDPIVAISAQIYGTGSNCGLWVSVTNTATDETAYGMVRDECQSCGPDDLDMSTGLFEQIGDLNTGVLPIAWEYMPEGWSPS